MAKNSEKSATTIIREYVPGRRKQSTSQHVENVIARIFSKQRSISAESSIRDFELDANEPDWRWH